MIEFIEDAPNQKCICKTDKMVSDIIIDKQPGNYSFFIVRFEQGAVPKELAGKYSSIKKAQDSVENYLKNKNKSKTVLRNEFGEDFERRKKVRNASEPEPKSS
tara:strand:- start:1604 stop:1912 length:309 start_codon:yes stop_codon:yes gene_type:complete